ncbi:MAG: hypothetical protein Fur003_2980 [Candidatus Dojkabacteria bacterium]
MRFKTLLKTSHSLLLTLFFAGVLFILSPQKANAASLLQVSDYITSDIVNSSNVVHNVAFIIPSGGHELTPSDYIRITLPNFTDVTAATSGSGWSGTPLFTVDGNTVLVTNVTASSTVRIGISGMTATNPANLSQFEVFVETSNDAAGTIVYDSGSTIASTISGVSTASVTIPSNNSSIELSGFTSPNAFVTILLNGSIAGTALADNNGNFSKLLTGLDSNAFYDILIFAQDVNLIESRSVGFSITTLPYTNHVISNIVLPPTITLDKEVYQQNETLKASGMGYPNSLISLFIGTSPQTYSLIVNTNSAGEWEYLFDINESGITLGEHIAYAKINITGGYTSIFTETVPFTIVEATALNNNILPPTVSSPQATNDIWTNKNDITMKWSKPAGAIGYNYQLSKDKSFVLTKEFVKNVNSQYYSDLQDSTYYFKVAAYNGSKWSSTTTFTLKVDATPPENFAITITPSDLKKIDKLPYLTFNTTDAMSGIKAYYFQIDNEPEIEVTSPYQMTSIYSGNHTIYLTALDNAGNKTVEILNIKVIDVPAPIIINPKTDDQINNTDPLIIEGEAIPNARIELFLDEELIGAVLSDKNGKFSYEYIQKLSLGIHKIKAVATNSNGITGYYSKEITFESVFYGMPIARCSWAFTGWLLLLGGTLSIILIWPSKQRTNRSRQIKRSE